MSAKWILLLLVGMVCAAQQPRANPFQSDAEAIDVGRATFRIFCSPCHGIRAEGGRGPDLRVGIYSVGDSDADLFQVISEGVPGSEMPGYGARMTEDSIWRIVAYLRSIARRETVSVPGDAAAGKEIYWGKGQCGSCHRIGVEGGRFGPDLSRAGRSRSLAYLRESIVSPSANLTPGYATITVVTRDGKKISGVEKNIDNFSAQFMDSEENIHSYLRSEVPSMTREFRSLMPEGYGSAFSEKEMNDLLAYLVSLGREEGDE